MEIPALAEMEAHKYTLEIMRRNYEAAQAFAERRMAEGGKAYVPVVRPNMQFMSQCTATNDARVMLFNAHANDASANQKLARLAFGVAYEGPFMYLPHAEAMKLAAWL